MQYQSLALLATALTAVTALPSQIKKRDWTNDEGGNLKIIFSDETIKLGTLPTSEIMNKLSEACSTEGQCETSVIEITGYQYVNGGLGGSVYDETLQLTPSGSYPTWIHNGLLDALSAAVNTVAKCEDVHNTPTCPNPAVYCPAEPYTVTQCTVPKYWGINYQPGDLGNSAPPFIGASMEITIDTGGFCDTFTTIGSAVAGAVNGAAGGIFTLIGLACQ